MSLNIKAFGMTADATETFSFETPHFADTSELRRHLERTYPSLTFMKYSIAVDRKITSGKSTIHDGAEIALLPPFSGG